MDEQQDADAGKNTPPSPITPLAMPASSTAAAPASSKRNRNDTIDSSDRQALKPAVIPSKSAADQMSSACAGGNDAERRLPFPPAPLLQRRVHYGDTKDSKHPTLPAACSQCQLGSKSRKVGSQAPSESPPRLERSTKKAKLCRTPSDSPKESDSFLRRFERMPLVTRVNHTFNLYEDDLIRLAAAGFAEELSSDDGVPICKLSKDASISCERFDELELMSEAVRQLQPDVAEYEACRPWIKGEGFHIAGSSLQKSFPTIQPLPHGSIDCFWEGSRRLGMAQWPNRKLREEMHWEHCCGYFADFQFTIQNYTNSQLGVPLQTSPCAEWMKLTMCALCESAQDGQHRACTHEPAAPSDDVLRDHVMLVAGSKSNEEVPRRTPRCWFEISHYDQYFGSEPSHTPGKKNLKKKCAFEFLKRHGRAKSPEKLLGEIAKAYPSLTSDEVLAVMLYSGPMYLVYNGILSRSKFPLKPENVWQHHEDFSSFDQPKHAFLTTITVLLSALRKLSLSTDLPQNRLLYRGTSGRLHLPDCFWGYRHGGAEASSVRGYTEFGFQSFTSKRDIAIRYSGTHDASRPFPAILKFKAGAIDRGADVSRISQYPQEVEFLFPPFSFVAPDFDSSNEVVKVCLDDGVLQFAEIPIRVNVNGRSPTIEELQDRKRIQHLQIFKEELSCLSNKLCVTRQKLADGQSTFAPQLEETKVNEFIRYVVLQCKQERRRHKKYKENFQDHRFAHQMSLDMMNCLQWAHEKLKLWLCRGTFFDSMTQCAKKALEEESRRKQTPKSMREATPSAVEDWWTLRRCHRMWLAHVRRQIKSMSEIEAHAPVNTAPFETLNRYSLELLAAKGRCLPCGTDQRKRFNTDSELLVVEAGADGWDAEDIDALATCEATDKDMHSWVDDIIGANDYCDPEVTAMTGLLKACESGNEATVRHLLSGRYRASVHKQCKSGATPLFYAAANGHPSIIALLHEQRADVNAQVSAVSDATSHRIITGQTPLCIAAKFGHTECVKCLLDLKADATKTNSRGQTPLDIAMEPSSALAEKLPQWSETPRAHQFHKIVGLLQRKLGFQAQDVSDAFSEFQEHTD